ncbi:unnamed protein product [Cuscuta epithymum]|uniref:Uncharacterized protein n=1 Tax=Cuscuta epithymum TaxID=186058 RepID=A0AAV0EUW6_9ASTE|nr:unnamed protein product [Cuscuta epithymum]
MEVVAEVEGMPLLLQIGAPDLCGRSLGEEKEGADDARRQIGGCDTEADGGGDTMASGGNKSLSGRPCWPRRRDGVVSVRWGDELLNSLEHGEDWYGQLWRWKFGTDFLDSNSLVCLSLN